ncbi:ABC transporter substrate-binding protein [Cellulophaga sp. Hel_I_12]|uniref:ABC transporter substrate-binding protein n=1 Tax=Cellulophaga sp. Hel_I_12 TaxID=1249972 RepID=UPI000648F764|nr:ABC transporter substrate-binding protein [Cellulophaga sp. Hel_I_12]
MKHSLLFLLVVFSFSCKLEKKEAAIETHHTSKELLFAKGFTIEKQDSGVTLITLKSPWPGAEKAFTYALVPKEKIREIKLNKKAYDAIVAVPIEKVIVTSTTHVPALESLGVANKLVGFPDTRYISSEETRALVETGKILELGVNGALNTEMVIALQPDLVVGYSLNSENNNYETIQAAQIPVVYNGDWMEESPLGKAEWIKFFAAFFDKEKEADHYFLEVATAYQEAKALAKTATNKPQVISGAIYKDIWYLPGGKSWAAQFISDASANYIYHDNEESGSLSLSWESVLEKGQSADFWISPAQFTSHNAMLENSPHYQQFDAFKKRQVYSFAGTVGSTGGVIYYELAPNRPDVVLKDLIHIFHPELLPNYTPYFFKPLK